MAKALEYSEFYAVSFNVPIEIVPIVPIECFSIVPIECRG